MDEIYACDDGDWWFNDPVTGEAVGPYSRKADAEDDYRGIVRFYKTVKKEESP